MSELNETKIESGPDKSGKIIILNGRETLVKEKKLSFEQIVILALKEYSPSETVSYSVTYSKGVHADQGIMNPGDVVTVKKGMIINATKTDRS